MGRSMKYVVKALFTAYAVTAVMLFVLAFVMLKFQLNAQKMSLGILACYVVSCLAGGYLCGRKAGKRKFLWGLLLGSLYFLMLLAFSCLGERSIPIQVTQALTAFCLCAGSGMAGGMIS